MPRVLASSFADPDDVRVFKRCKALGHSDQFCFKTGDNGIGKWGANTAQEHTPMCALPRDVWQRAGKKGGAKVRVTYRGEMQNKTPISVEGILADTMPSTANIKNGCGIDLNPAFAKKLGLKPPFKVPVEWEWA
jgi:hypothetical protein